MVAVDWLRHGRSDAHDTLTKAIAGFEFNEEVAVVDHACREARVRGATCHLDHRMARSCLSAASCFLSSGSGYASQGAAQIRPTEEGPSGVLISCVQVVTHRGLPRWPPSWWAPRSPETPPRGELHRNPRSESPSVRADQGRYLGARVIRRRERSNRGLRGQRRGGVARPRRYATLQPEQERRPRA